jgi:hypothetical protein
MNRAPEVCPNCGCSLPRQALSCPECGSCDETGWKDDGVLYEDEADFDYEAYVEREFTRGPSRAKGMPVWAWVLAIILLLSLLSRAFR